MLVPTSRLMEFYNSTPHELGIHDSTVISGDKIAKLRSLETNRPGTTHEGELRV